MFLALVLTIVTQPLRYWLQRRMPSWAASVICLVAHVRRAPGAGALALVVSAARFATLLPTYQDEFANLVDDATRLAQEPGRRLDRS